MLVDREKIRGLLRERGLRPTPARVKILALLNDEKKHLSTEEVIEALRSREEKASAATVYQNLSKLADYGLLLRITGADGVIRYDSNPSPHHHLICVQCGRIEDVELEKKGLPKLRPLSSARRSSLAGWQFDDLQVEFKSLCPRCRKK